MDDPEIIQKMMEQVVTNPEMVAERLGKYFTDDTPVNDLGISRASRDVYWFIPHLIDRETGEAFLTGVFDAITHMLHERGYRNNVLTHQEHLLTGSSGSGLNKDEDVKESPYTVGCVLSGDATPEEARVARALNYISGMAVGEHWGVDGIHAILLPEIDEYGVTVRDPVLVDADGKVLATSLVEGAPYKR